MYPQTGSSIIPRMGNARVVGLGICVLSAVNVACSSDGSSASTIAGAGGGSNSGTGGSAGGGGILFSTGGTPNTGGAGTGGSSATGGSGGVGPDAGELPPPTAPPLPAGWSGPTRFTPPADEGKYASFPAAAMAPSGKAEVLVTSGLHTYWAPFDKGGWGASTALFDRSHHPVTMTILPTSGVGVALLGVRDANDAYVATAARRSSAGAWTLDPAIAAAAPDVNEASVALSSNGTALAVWIEGGARIKAGRFDGSAWQTPTVLDDTALYDLVQPTVAIDAQGRGVAVWRDWAVMNPTMPGPEELRASTFDGTSWSTAQEISGGKGGYLPGVAMDASGNAIAIFEGDYDIYAASYSPATGFAAPVPIGRAGQQGAYGAGPEIGFDAAGNALATWREKDSAGAIQTWAARHDASGWKPAETLSTATSADEVDAYRGLSVSPDGHAVTIWSMSHATGGVRYRSFWANRYVPGSGWQPAVQLDDGANASGGATIAAAAADGGKGAVVWERRTLSEQEVFAAWFE